MNSHTDEPIEFAWSVSGYDRVVEHKESICGAEGCSGITRNLPTHTRHNGFVRNECEVIEHIAGPRCAADQGYSGHRRSIPSIGSRSNMRVSAHVD